MRGFGGPLGTHWRIGQPLNHWTITGVITQKGIDGREARAPPTGAIRRVLNNSSRYLSSETASGFYIYRVMSVSRSFLVIIVSSFFCNCGPIPSAYCLLPLYSSTSACISVYFSSTFACFVCNDFFPVFPIFSIPISASCFIMLTLPCSLFLFSSFSLSSPPISLISTSVVRWLLFILSMFVHLP